MHWVLSLDLNVEMEFALCGSSIVGCRAAEGSGTHGDKAWFGEGE